MVTLWPRRLRTMSVKRPPSEPPTMIVFFEDDIQRSHAVRGGSCRLTVDVDIQTSRRSSSRNRRIPWWQYSRYFSAIATIINNTLFIGQNDVYVSEHRRGCVDTIFNVSKFGSLTRHCVTFHFHSGCEIQS